MKTHRGAPKDKATALDPTPPPPTKPCTLCDAVGHATHTCPELPRIQPMVTVAFPNSSASETSVSPIPITKNPKALRTNNPVLYVVSMAIILTIVLTSRITAPL